MNLVALAENWKRIRDRIISACKRSGRSEREVKVLVASKYMSPDTIRSLVSLGLTRFGENQVQASEKKMKALEDLSIEWHFIGHLQTNKINRFLSLNFSLLHSVDSIKLIQALEKRCQRIEKVVNCLLEVNLYRDPNKYGFQSEEEVLEALEFIRTKTRWIRCQGLMTMAPWGGGEVVLREVFSRVRSLAVRLNLKELSMGTSQDFEIAIEEGATIVRIGSAFLNST